MDTTDVIMKNKDMKLFVERKKLGDRRLRASIGGQGSRAKKNKYPTKTTCWVQNSDILCLYIFLPQVHFIKIPIKLSRASII